MSSGNEAHIRLIFTANTPLANSSQPAERNRQLAFPYPESGTIFFTDIGGMGRQEFAKILTETGVRWIFDVRVVPRLDGIAPSRAAAFHMFQKAKATYVDLFGLLDIKSYRTAMANPALWGVSVGELLRESERKGPYLFLFDDLPLMQAAEDLLPPIIKPMIGKGMCVARLGRSVEHQ